jgi:tetratricopeptide (TPR) repeat protein
MPSAILTPPPAIEWPFLCAFVPALPSGPVGIPVERIDQAFVNRQTANTRLVTTQASYLLQTWLDAIGNRDDVRIFATADRDGLAEHAPEVLARRGPFADPRITIELTGAPSAPSAPSAPPAPSALSAPSAILGVALLVRAFRADDPAARLRLCIEALNQARTAPALLAAASTCMEVNDLDGASRDLDAALALAPDWPAAHFEHGKLWLRRDDMEHASEAFARAAALLPTFTAAWSNLGATLGELDRPTEALSAFERALAHDPLNPQALNNVGVVRRELGHLDASEAAFRQVTGLVPELAFGHYNLGHTLFLQGRYQAALSAYVEGQRRDMERNAVQATRLAMCRLATGDGDGAIRDLRLATTQLPLEYKRQLLADTQAIAWALLTHRPDLPGWKPVSDWIASELAKLM